MNAPSKLDVPTRPLVYEKIAAVQGALARHGIGKDSRNDAQNYSFRGIDAVYNALAPLLAEHGLCVLPRILSRDMRERTTVKTYNGQSKESVLFYVTVEAEFDFVAAEDGSLHTIRTFGEAMDSGDKATNKAMSAAYKYAAFMAFAIPTEGDNDADATSHEVAARSGSGDGQFGGNRQVSHTGPATDEQGGMPDAEYVKLVNLFKATNGRAGPTLTKYAIKNLRQLDQTQYAEVVEELNERLAKMAKQETASKARSEFASIDEDSIPF